MTDASPAPTGSAVRTPPQPPTNPADIARSGDFYLLIGVLIGVLFVGALILWFVDRWRKRQDREDDNPGMSLSNFRRMFEAGELTQAEYDKILARMAPEIKGAKATPPPPARPLTEPQAEPPAAPPAPPKSE